MADIKDTIEEVVDKAEQASDRLNRVISVLVAVLATVMALFNVKDGNIVQAMAQAQARGVDAWSYYQAKSTKQSLAENMLDQLTFERERGGALTPEATARVFQKFYRAPGARAGGTGLGLPIARGLVRALKGDMEAGNHPGGGALFTLRLPVQVHQPKTP